MTKPLPLRQSSVIQTLAILIGVLATLYFAKDVLIPLAFAVTLTLILTPIVVRLVKMRIPRALAAIVVVGVSIVAAIGMGVVIVNQLIQVLNELPEYQENIHAKVQAMRAPAKGAMARATENVRELGQELSIAQTPVTPPPRSSALGRKTPADLEGPVPVQVVAEPANELQYLRDLTRPFLRPLAMLGIVLILAVFLLIEQDDLRDRLFHLAGLSRMNK